MVVTLTTETITGASGEAETVVVAREEIYNSTGTTIVDLEVSIAIDYTDYYKRIATSMEAIAEKLTSIDTNIEALKQAGDPRSIGDGIRTIQPYGYIGTVLLYLLYIKQGQLLEEDFADQATQSQALSELNNLITEVFNNLNPNAGGFN